MKRTSLILLLLFVPFFLFGQQIVNQTISYLHNGNAEGITKNIDQTLDLSLQGEQTVYRKTQATFVLNKFFNANKNQKFNVEFKGTSSDSSSIYIIGNLDYPDKDSYGIYLFFKKNKGKWYLKEMKIE